LHVTLTFAAMGYVRITIWLIGGGKRSGIRKFPEPMNMEDIRDHSWLLAGEVLGRGAIEDVSVEEVSANDPGVVAIILTQHRINDSVPRSDGEHPYLKHQRRKPPR
jgi:hypothetical protein